AVLVRVCCPTRRSSDLAWTFTQFEPLDHGNAGEDLKTLDLSGLIKAVDFDNDSVTLGTGQLTVAITDDQPELVSGGVSSGSVDESGRAHVSTRVRSVSR